MTRRSATVSGGRKQRGRKVAKTSAKTPRRKPASVAELRAQMIAASRVLELIAKSPSDLQPVFDAIADSANRLIGGFSTAVYRFLDGDIAHLAAFTPTTPAADEILKKAFPRPIKDFPQFELTRSGNAVQIPDVEQEPDAEIRHIGRARGFRSMLAVPLINQANTIGLVTITRTDPGPFAEHHVQLLRTLADQAVIAIQNAKLFNETQESLRQQTATAEVLQIISDSPGELQPVFEAVLQKATHICDAQFGSLFRFDGDAFYFAADVGVPEALRDHMRRPGPFRGLAGGMIDRIHRTRQVQHTADYAADVAPGLAAKLGGARSTLGVPILRDDELVGAIVIYRQEVRPFCEREIELVRSFAAQAAIAIENARLFNETKEALERQTATSDILNVIAGSPTDTRPVFEAIAGKAKDLVGGFSSVVFRFIEGQAHLEAFTPTTPQADDVLTSSFPMPVADFAPFLMAQSGDVTQIADIEDMTDPVKDIARARGFRSILFAPLMNKGASIGLIAVTRTGPGQFAEHYVQLLKTFADQAVIAIENVRLFDEVQAKTRDLEVSLQQQTATGDVLRIISRSVAHAAPVFDTILEACERLFHPFDAAVYLVDGDRVKGVAHRGPGSGDWGADSMPLEGSSTGLAIAQRRAIHFPDLADKPELPEDKRATVRETGGMTVLYAPMISQESGVGSLVVTRQPKKPFTDAEIGLIQTFADQAVIAIENARLFDEVQARTQELSKSLEDLRTTQDRLVQTEKLASLGQLTAGIAHEIKNPLNFVNNFSALSSELTDELKDVLAGESLSEPGREQVDELTGLLKDNLGKVVQHGKRADSIVKNMLQHSREGSGERRSQDLNALVSESLNLAYHGARAERSDFNITLEQDLDPDAGAVEMYPQDLTRALLNLISNGFYAAIRRKIEAGGASTEPVLSAATRNAGNTVEIRIRDNGTGIPAETREKIFNPFFTTKPTGEGTGLGLSMTHDIIVKQHGGRIDLKTEPGAFTEFTITLPRANEGTKRT